MYQLATPKIKQKYCIHDYHLKYQQGTKAPFSVCIKCGNKRKVIFAEHGGIKFTLPASKRSNFKTFLEHFEEMQESPNWFSIKQDGWDLPGREEPHDWCGSYYTLGCPKVEKHSHLPEAKGKIFIKRRQRFCYRARCERCKLKWMYREADKSAKRLEKYEKKSKKKLKHIVVSPPWWEQSRPVKELRKKARLILEELRADGGNIIIHPYKTEKRSKMLYHALHFHVVGSGWLEGSRELYKKNGWIVVNLGPVDSAFATVLYQLSHAGIKKGAHTLTWFGDLSYSELKMEYEEKKEVCPACQAELVELKYFYVGKPPPPDARISMYVDPEGWSVVERKPKSELTGQERYQYALERELYDANKGISIAS